MNHVIQVLLHRLLVLGKLALGVFNAFKLKSQPVEFLADLISLLLRFLGRTFVFGNDVRELLVGSLQLLVLRLECLVFFYQSSDEFLQKSSVQQKSYLDVLEGQVGLSVLAELLGVDELDDLEAV